MDIRTIIEINNTEIDWGYLLGEIKNFSQILEKPTILEEIKRLKK